MTGSLPPGSFPGGENLGLPPGMGVPAPFGIGLPDPFVLSACPASDPGCGTMDIPLFSADEYFQHFWLYHAVTNVHACSGGGFGYVGRTFSIKLAHVEAVALLQYDSRTGGSHGGLVGVGAGPFTLALETMRNWRDWSASNGITGLGGGHIGKFELGALAQSTQDGLVLGGYAGIGVGGGGGYLTISVGGPCRK